MENSDFAVLEAALKEVLEEQKNTNKVLEGLTGEVAELKEKTEMMNEKVDNVQVVAPPTDTKPFFTLWAGFAEKIRKIIEAQPKTVIHQRRFLFFPETNTGEYYRIVFGRLIPWGMLLVGGLLLFRLGHQYIEKSAETNNRRYYYETYENAFDRLDTMLGPSGHKKLIEALRLAAQNHP